MIEKLDTNIEILDIDEASNYGKFALYPLERGYGTTIGNSMRRVLLSSLPGSSVSKILIEGVLHEFSIIDGVVEDVPEIILNLKGLDIKKNNDEDVTLFLDIEGPKIVTAKDISKDSSIEIANPDHYIATVNDKAKLFISLEVTNGKGYRISDQNKSDSDPIGTIAIDSSFTPVEKVNYYVENTRVGEATDYDKLVIEVWTNGTISPQEALSEGASILIDDFTYFKDLPNVEFVEEEEIEEVEEETFTEPSDTELGKTIEEMDLSLRSFNCLKRAGFDTVGDIVEKSEAELKTIKNFGKKSLEEVKDKIHDMGLSLKDE
ncbi:MULTISPECIES: DNA-directed RNA polymerase subunit alpha [Anaerococcus]|uniref:DNA-directed RNA polymerase subunit alpha n=2 Tax=Anaerococcus TaxID=165779 RepID=A0A3E2TKW8_9FIRM|nr:MULTISPECIES: DNA-directed RNA polymerase subunit alpha [Anaerococcus]MDU1828139.1 DNA-directed RNA polymerase subunit alpha [Anaerococcus sp.]MDU1864344.1 DNA-directed RNA polymerase subunit alpha [Anaerococcus sp.]MDU2353252.1 DNA-directed RNA polymerase subunit alpha [Anaerococcus sp.]MDU2565248.1 DNA-directed RNA polymerase subunit alpha [Anaerococcus sp.]MDU3210965.1 DNA-directed RNA polymerase subunit alpha [Anaerococcus sp.]